MKKSISCIAGFLLAQPLTGVHSTATAELVLVENGQSKAPIVVFEEAPDLTLLAVEDLADYLEKSGGARPEILHGTPDPIPDRAIWVGYQPVLDDLFPGVDFEFSQPEEILLVANDQHLAITGRDRWNPEHTIYEGGRHAVEGVQQEYGTANAIYTFLQDQLGVRWFWPGEEDVPTREIVAVTPFEYRFHPPFRQRNTILRNMGWGRPSGRPGNDRGDWGRYQRLFLDSLSVPVQGHGFGDWFDRFHAEYPEYFALQPDGTRSGFPGRNNAKICESNPAVWERWIEDVAAQLAEDPNQKVFSAAANDSWASGHCICADCRAWDHPDNGPRGPFTWQGISQDYVALSDRQVTFANHLGRLLKERFPDQDLSVVILAYGHSRPPPLEAVPDDNVIIGNVANFFIREPSVDDRGPGETTPQEMFLAWAEVAPNQLWRPNVGSPSRWQDGGPGGFRRVMKEFPMVADTGCLGINIDNTWDFWATQGPVFYTMAQLGWNPHADGEAILDDYYARGFGPGADEVKAYWELLEDARESVVDEGSPWAEVFTGELYEQAEEFLDEARGKIDGSGEGYARRLEFVRAGLEYLKLYRENVDLVRELRNSANGDEDVMNRARENWDAIVEIAREHPVALNYNWTVRNPPGRLDAIYPGN